MPLEGQAPVESPDHGLVRLHVELKGVPVDGVDDRAHDGALVLTDPERGERKKGSYRTLSSPLGESLYLIQSSAN